MMIIHRGKDNFYKENKERYQKLRYRNFYCTKCDTFPDLDELKFTKDSVAHVVYPDFWW